MDLHIYTQYKQYIYSLFPYIETVVNLCDTCHYIVTIISYAKNIR